MIITNNKRCKTTILGDIIDTPTSLAVVWIPNLKMDTSDSSSEIPCLYLLQQHGSYVSQYVKTLCLRSWLNLTEGLCLWSCCCLYSWCDFMVSHLFA